MRKIRILLLTSLGVLLFAQDCHAQLKIGAKAGYSLGKLSDANENIYSQNYKSTDGFDWGILLEIPLTHKFSIQAEIVYTSRGGERMEFQPVPSAPLDEELKKLGYSLDLLNQLIVFTGGSPVSDENPLYADFKSVASLNYMEIPVLVKVTWGRNWQFYLESGPSFSFLLNAQHAISGYTTFYTNASRNEILLIPNSDYTPDNNQPLFIELPPQNLDASTDTKNDLKTFNFGLHGGAGIIKKLADRHEVFFDARMTYSFIPIQKDVIFGKSKVGGIIFSLGYTYKL